MNRDMPGGEWGQTDGSARHPLRTGSKRTDGPAVCAVEPSGPGAGGNPRQAVLDASPALASWVAGDPSLSDVFSSADLCRPLDRAAYLDRLEGAEREEEPAVFFRRLRRLRKRELFRIVAREALGLAPVEVTAGEVSAFAEAAVETALQWAGERLEARYGALAGDDGVPIRSCVLGMGKLGGGELNLCSDVDLVFLYRTARGVSGGGRRGAVDARPFVAELVKLACEALGRVSEDGLVFRVDLDLRPEGRSGELAQPVENAVLYYQSWGQTWERAALLRAKPVAGDLALGWDFLSEVQPFVYRRSLDFTTVEDFKEIKRAINRDRLRRLDGADDLKLGKGGIRELEFFVQTLQLIHGGRIPEVRERHTLTALARLSALGLVESRVADGLALCWRFLRGLEHAVQSLHFLQTHRLPGNPEELARVARRLGYRDGDELRRELEEVRTEVHAAYSQLFHRAERARAAAGVGAANAVALLTLDPHGPGADDALAKAGFLDPGRAREALRTLREGHPGTQTTSRSRRILDRLGPCLLVEASGCADPDRALFHLAEFLQASGAREGYLALLEENPATARLLMTLFGTSGFLSRYLIQRPELLDELVLGSTAARRKSAFEFATALSEGLKSSRDEEEWLDALRRFRNVEFLRIALNDLWGGLPPEEVGEQLSLVAEACLAEACSQAYRRLADKYGNPKLPVGSSAPLAVLGLGKLGGREIDYSSDLDVVFLYDGEASPTGRQGVRGAANAEFFALLAQRIIGALATRTREGVAFRMDARLRPSGQAGPLVTSLDAFREHHARGSQVWERQALVKLRPAAGDCDTGGRVRAVADEILYSAPPTADPRPEIARMRDRIEREVAREASGRIDLKSGAGGIVDVEFAVQAMQLLHGWECPGIRTPNTREALEGLSRLAILGSEDTEALSRGYAFLRRVEARLRLIQDRPTDVLPVDRARMDELARGLGYRGEEAGAALAADVEGHRRRVRAAFDSTVRGGAK